MRNARDELHRLVRGSLEQPIATISRSGACQRPIWNGPMSERILIVDNDPEGSKLLRQLLNLKGCDARVESDSRRALDTAREFQPDVVMLDYLMPYLDGAEVAWQFASDPSWRGVRLIVCSALPREEFVTKLPPANIAIVSKPIDLEALLVLIRGGAAPTSPGHRWV